ncbi:MAG: hypothetical protein PHG05_01620 [Candidatus Nanoarchaeia archaeon]|nr:hypothetical protein [Candidatus Nanoarchaeia archaeon]
MFKEVYFKSWKQIKPVLFIPDLISIIITYGLFLFFMIISGFSQFGSLASFDAQSFFEAGGLSFLQENLLRIISYLILFVLVNFFIGSGLMALKFKMLRNIIEKRKINLFRIIKEDEKAFWRVVLLRIFVYLIGLILLIIAWLIGYLLINTIPKGVALVIMGILIIVAVLLLKLMLLLRYACLFLDKKNTLKSLITSSRAFFKKPGYLLAVLILILITQTVLILFMVGINYGIGFVGSEGLIGAIFMVLGLLSYAFFRILKLVWTDLFLFNIYNHKFRH